MQARARSGLVGTAGVLRLRHPFAMRMDAFAQDDKWHEICTDCPKRPRNLRVTRNCELDHFVPRYLGGADTLDDILPQCGFRRW
jgi:5-methylcytosine-specific restriction endonuclease McrA